MKSNTITMNISGSGAMTGTTTIVSDPVPLEQIYGFAVQAIYTGTPVGTFSLQASSDAPARTPQTSNGGPDTVTNWATIVGSTQAISGAGNFMWNVSGGFYRYVRLVYTNTSGTGTLTAELSVKGV